jgi:hypothetical protein
MSILEKIMQGTFQLIECGLEEPFEITLNREHFREVMEDLHETYPEYEIDVESTSTVQYGGVTIKCQN